MSVSESNRSDIDEVDRVNPVWVASGIRCYRRSWNFVARNCIFDDSNFDLTFKGILDANYVYLVGWTRKLMEDSKNKSFSVFEGDLGRFNVMELSASFIPVHGRS